MTPVLRCLSNMRWLRGQWYDPFGYVRHKQQELQHRDDIARWLQQLANLPHPRAANKLDDLLDLMLAIRGYGHVKDKYYKMARPQILARMTALAKADQPEPSAPVPRAAE